jgi:hypothetical protein
METHKPKHPYDREYHSGRYGLQRPTPEPPAPALDKPKMEQPDTGTWANADHFGIYL